MFNFFSAVCLKFTIDKLQILRIEAYFEIEDFCLIFL